jgi:hypothetical protein
MIPKKLHFIFGLADDFGGKQFSFCHWAAIKSAQVNNPGFETHYWFSHKPNNYFFDDLEPSLILHPITAPSQYLGKPIPHVAHKTDLLRLQVLKEHGGVYLDLDTLTVRSFEPLLSHSCVMAQEIVESKLVGLCNAVILSEPNHSFLDAWISRFKDFRSVGRDQYWNESAVVWPWLVYSENQHNVTVLPTDAFFIPDWTRSGLEEMFIDNRHFPKAYTHHLWESFSWNALSRFNERTSFKHTSTYAALLRQHLAPQMNALAENRNSQIQLMLKNGNASLNLGIQTSFQSGSINVDLHENTGMDFVVDFDREPLPFSDSTFQHVSIARLLERLTNVEWFFKELYRVCRDNATIEFTVSHPRHDWFLRIPGGTAWLPESFEQLDREKNNEWIFSGDRREPLSVNWSVDFKTLSAEYRVADAESVQTIPRTLNFESKNLGGAIPYLNNIVGEFRMRLMCRKPLANRP